MENAIADRNAAQAETWAAHAQRVQAIQQRDEAYSLLEAREEVRTMFTPKFGRKVIGTQKLPRLYYQGISCGRIRNS